MKLGPVEIRLADRETKRRRPRDMNEIGATGTTFLSGHLVEEEYNRDLQGEKGRTVYDRMRRSDSQVKATLLVCQLPVRAADWDVEPASEEGRDVEIAEFIKDNLFEGMTITWDDFLRHVLLMLPFGFSMFEKVYEIRDNRVVWRKLAPRLPKTLFQWDLDDNGGLRGILQATWKGETYHTIPIPVEKLLVFTNEREGSNYEGISILRAAYKHWYYKDHLYRIDAVAAERHAMGIPKLTHPANAGDPEKNRLEAIGQRLYAMEQMYIRLAEGYDLTIEGLSGTIRDIMPSIEHHNREIPKAILAHFLELGAKETGSYALSEDQSGFFLMAERAVCNNIRDTMNRYAIPQLVDYNWPGVKAYPKMTYSGLDRRNMKDYSEAVTGLITSGGLTWDVELENKLRDMLDMPEKPEEEPAVAPEPEQPADPEEPDREQGKISTTSEGRWRRELTRAESAVAFSEIGRELDNAKDSFVQVVGEVRERQVANLVDAVMAMVEKRQMDKLKDVQVRYQTQMADKMMNVLREMFTYGRKQVKRELTVQKSTLAEGELLPLGAEELTLVLEYLRTKAKASASTLANKLRTSAIFEGLRQIKTGIVDRSVMFTTLTSLSDRELKTAAAHSVAEAFGFGRSTQAERQRGEIDRVQYSAILDENLCEKCAPLDGQEWDYDDPRTAYYASGNPECLGGSLCRCVLIYIATAEAVAVK